MMLSDGEIATLIEGKGIGFLPYDEKYLNPASVDMTLHEVIRRPQMNGYDFYPEVDTRAVEPGHTVPWVMSSSGYVLEPGDFILACTNEIVTLPDDIVARVEGKSSIGRIGLAVHITAGFIDPGFEGQITLEVANLAPWAIRLHPNMRIAQIAFQRLSAPAVEPYGAVGHYMGQSGPTESRFRLDT